jgi:PAS domain S-box-containing protein
LRNRKAESRESTAEKQRQGRYRSVFLNARDLIVVHGPDGLILEANERWAELTGAPASLMVGRRISDYAELAPDQESFKRAVSDTSGLDTTIALRRNDGRILYIEMSNTPLALDGRPATLTVGRDVTSNVITVTALADAEIRYRSLVDRIPDVVWTANVGGAITFISSNVAALSGFTAEELESGGLELWVSRIHPEDQGRMLLAEPAQRSSDLEYRWQKKDGTWIWIRSRATATYTRDGACYLDGIFADVTARRQLEEGLRQAQKMEAIAQLTGGIAHDFNNILAVILANSHFLLQELAPDDPRHADADEIKLAAERAAALTRQLLAFSRRQVLEPAIVDLNASIAGLENMLRRLIGEDIEFAVQAANDLGSVRVDAGQLEQVIMNLAVNARDAMPTGGKLVISTENVEVDEQYVGTQGPVIPGRYVVLSVADTGSGMDAQTKRHIFEPFFTTKEPGKGTGLGLSTCYGIVKQSGGYIWVYSELGHGTVFKVYLPRVDEQPAAAPRSGAELMTRGSETILLVEDDETLRTAIQRMLEPLGYRVLVASSGAHALELARRYSTDIDLVLSDVVMPGLCGPEAVEQVCAHARTARTLFMSGYSDHAAFDRGTLQAALNFIQKPFAPDALARKIRQVLAEHPTRESL